MKRLVLFCTLVLIATTGLAAKQEKVLICHVGNEMGPNGEVYDPACVPEEANGYCSADAGKIDLILVAQPANHLGNPFHTYEGISDYTPDEVGASGEGTEDSDGDGVDDGCQPPESCPCWDEVDLQSVTSENHLDNFSCETAANLPNFAVIQNLPSSRDVEGGFLAATRAVSIYGVPHCSAWSVDFPIPTFITDADADACIAQIVTRCAEIGHPIVPDN